MPYPATAMPGIDSRTLLRAFLQVLIVWSLALAACTSIDRILGYQITFEVTLSKPGAFQLFYSSDGVFSEDNSQRYWCAAGGAQKITLRVPSSKFKYLRVDPMEESGGASIGRVVADGAFSSVDIGPAALGEALKPLQMVRLVERSASGVVLQSEGNDPALLLDLTQWPWPVFSLRLLAFSGIAALALAACFSSLLKASVRQQFRLLLLSAFVASLVVMLFYPGFMTYDSIHALRAARNGVTESVWPPIVSYVWRVVELFSSNPSAMHGTQVFLLTYSMALLVFYFTRRMSWVVFFLPLYFLVPVVLGTVAVIWKDVLMAAFLLAGMACAFWTRAASGARQFWSLSLACVAFVFLGVCARHNAIVAAIPIMLSLSWSICVRRFGERTYLSVRLWLVWLAMVVCVYAGKGLLDRFSIPEGNRLAGSTVLVQIVRVMDIAGASICANENLLGDLAPGVGLDDIKQYYDARHSNYFMRIFDKMSIDERLTPRWIGVAFSHPVCFWYNKVQMTKYLLGANAGEQYVVTAPEIYDNEFGYRLSPSRARDGAVAYIVNASTLFFFRPWFIYLLAVLAFGRAALLGRVRHEHLVLYSSALFYAAGLFFFGNAGDARFLFYTTTLLILAPFTLLVRFDREKPAPAA